LNGAYSTYQFAATKTHYLVMEPYLTDSTPITLQTRLFSTAPTLPASFYNFGGTINPGEGGKLYKFNVTAGQIFLLDTLSLSVPAGATVEVLGDRPAEVLDPAFEKRWKFEEAGTRYLWIESDQPTSVDFSLTLPFVNDAVPPFAFDVVTTNYLDFNFVRKVYTIQGLEGRMVYFDGLDETSPAARLTLFRDDRPEVQFSRTTAENFAYTFPVTGEYTLIVGEMAGTFEFRVVDVQSLPFFPLNTNVLGTVLPDEQSRLWRVYAALDKQIVFDSAATPLMRFEGFMDVFDPNGLLTDHTIAPTNNDLAEQLTLEGSYLLAIGAGAVQFDYDVRARTGDTLSSPATLGFGTTSALLQDPNDNHDYTFGGIPGQRIYFEPTGAASFSLIDPNGNVVPTVGDFSYMLLDSGEYTVRVSSGPLQQNLFYSFRLLSQDTPAVVPLNVQTTGTAPGTTQFYRLPAVAGDRFFFDQLTMVGPITTGNRWVLYSPQGTEIFDSAFIGGDQTVTLPDTGDYLLAIRSPGGGTTYSFQINLVPNPAATVTGLDRTVSGAVSQGNPVLLNFSGSGGQRVFFDVQDRASQGMPTRLIGPGNLVVDANATTDRMFILPLSGDYRIEMSTTGGSAVPFKVRLVDASALPVTPPNTPFPINFDNTFKGDVWAFDAVVGDLVAIEVQQEVLNGNYRIISPDGTSQNYNPSLSSTRITQTGRHYLVFNGLAQGTPIVGAGTIWNYSSLPLILDENPITINFSPGREWHAYSFDLVDGERVFFTPLATPAPVLLKIFSGPVNEPATISLDQITNPAVFTTLRPGRHTLIVARTANTPLDFSFQIHKAAILEEFGKAR